VTGIRDALRLLRRAPGYTIVAILTMALGIGATTTLFSVAYGVLMKPLPWPDADRIVRIVETRDGRQPRLANKVTNGTYFAWRDQPATIEAIAGYSVANVGMTFNWSGAGEPVRLAVSPLTPSAFEVLRARPIRGRLFTDNEVPPAGPNGVDTPRPAVISYALWRDRFGGTDDVLGRVIRLDDVSHTIVGVMPASFAFPDTETRVWTPMPIPSVIQPRGGRSMMIFAGIARLKAGVSLEQAAAEGTSRARQAPDPGFAALAMFGSSAPSRISVTPMAQAMTADVRPAILVLFAAVALLLIAAVANVGSLQIARATTRRREIAIRAALGAGRRELVRRLLSESALVGAAGAAVGVALTFASARALPSILPSDFPRAADITVDVPVLAFAAALAIAASIAAGLLPVFTTRHIDIAAALAQASAASAGGRPAGRLRTAIMAAQVAVAVLLLVGAALLARSFVALMHADLGYEPRNMLTARLDPPQRTDGPTRVRIADAVVGRMRAIPGVTHAAAGNALPFMSLGQALGTELPSPANPAVKLQVHANVRLVSPDYIAAMGLPLLQGRLLSDEDGEASPAIVVSRSFARQYLGPSPIGTHVPMAVANGGRTDWEIVGVVGDMRQTSATEPQTPDVFVSYRQAPSGWGRFSIFFAIRAADDPAAHIAALRTAVREQDPALVLDSIMTMEERVATSLAKPRLYALLLGGFAFAALALAGVGLFGVLSYVVAQRAREIAIRTALGAQVHDIVTLVLRNAMATALCGAVFGLASAYALTRYVSSFLYGVSPSDVVSYASVVAVVSAMAAIACLVPARRAARVDPLVALKTD